MALASNIDFVKSGLEIAHNIEHVPGDHARIVSNVSGEKFLIEPTLACIVPKSLERYYLVDKTYNDIYDAVGSSRSVEE